MLPLRSLHRSSPRLLSSRTPSAFARATILSSRSFANPTSPRLQPPVAQHAEAHDLPAYYHHAPVERPLDPLEPRSNILQPSAPPPKLSRSILQLPAPGAARSPPGAGPQAYLYPSTGVLDSLSMISICLRRREHIPRAYQIFRKLIEDSVASDKRVPDTEVWAMVTQGVASIGVAGDRSGLTWRKRAENLVAKWEDLHGMAGGRRPALAMNGIRVYQGWFNGLIQSGSPLDPMIHYLEDPALPVSLLLDNLDPSVLPEACAAIETLARSRGMTELISAVRDAQNVDVEAREELAKEFVTEITPVLEKGKGNKRKLSSPLDSNASQQDLGELPRFNIRNLRETLSSIDSAALPRLRQHALEAASLVAARAELRDAATRLAGSDVLPLGSVVLQGWMHAWLQELTRELTDRLTTLRAEVEKSAVASLDLGNPVSSNVKMKPAALLMYLELLPIDKLALITILEIMRMAGSGGVVDGMKALRGMVAVGKAIETEFRAETIKSIAGVNSPHWQRSIDPRTQQPTSRQINAVWKHIGEELAQKREGENPDESFVEDEPLAEDDGAMVGLESVWTPAWSRIVQLGIGAELIDALLKVAKVERTTTDRITGEEVTETQQAFSHLYEYVRGKKLGVIKLNPAIASRLARDDIGVVLHPKHLPMLVEPRPWVGHENGGYLLHTVPVMRYKDSVEQQSYLQEASAQGHLEPVFHGLDVLSSTPWSINRKVFDVVVATWNSGEAIADIPACEEKSVYDFPEKPESFDHDPQARVAYMEKLKLVVAQQRKDHAERCKFNYNLEIARSYLKDTFYLPHNMDFRGRAYPIPPHLSPVGDDLCRGLLKFGVKKPLGTMGMKWLQIHLANVYGYDKASFEDRARFAQRHEAEIFDSADKPLEGNRWWLQGEDPWQCLATCIELAAALRSPDPTLYECDLPVHQDGTCNGMQHYAALGGDVRGAKAVNLEAGDKPADIYTGVVDIVNKVIEEDKKNGMDVALLIKRPLGRKVVKQTVMTTVYGVTFVGAREQIAKQLTAREGIAQEDVYVVSGYIAKTVLNCIGDLFSGAKAIMDWLTVSARLISRSCPVDRVYELAALPPSYTQSGKKRNTSKEYMTSVIWTSHLGLPVVQPYRKAAKRQVMTALQSVYISDPNTATEVSSVKQSTAFPPNFIHSLDATHMLLTALKCKRHQVTFASVHDSYWTHPSTVDQMSSLIRDTFVELHSQDLVGKLREEFLERYYDALIPVEHARHISANALKRKIDLEHRRKAMSAVMDDHENAFSSNSSSSAASASDSTSEVFDTALLEGAAEMITSSPEELDAKVEEYEESSSSPSRSSRSSSSTVLSSPTSFDDSFDVDASESDPELDSDADAEDPVVGEGEPEEGEMMHGVETVMVGKQGWVRFRDILPPCPPRGVFQVDKVKESRYFFS